MSDPLSPVERIKAASRHLRGTILESLADPMTGALREDDTQLIKFHGSYQQDDRDLRAERRLQRLEPAFQFMIRVRVPGGVCSAAQWLALDAIARTYANHSVRITTRQAVQFHGILKRHLKASIADINQSLLDTLAACGDVNRNVMSTTLPQPASIRADITAVARRLSEHLTPRTRAYHEIWLGEEPLLSTADEQEPIYGATYLPRKFKIAIAVPPDNDVDVFAHDLGFIAIIEGSTLVGFNVVVGGGMGMSHGEFATFPRIGDVIGFCATTDVLAIAEAVVTAQRDLGDRTNRKHARLKYTIETLGLARFRQEVVTRSGGRLQPARPYHFTHNGDRYGWHEDADGRCHCTLFIESGRVLDTANWQALTALREIAAQLLGEFHFTPNQNLVIANVASSARSQVTAILARYGLAPPATSPLRSLTLACVGFPTCGLAMAESERYSPAFATRLEELLVLCGLRDAPITVRITGCPNGCARPYIAEIALVGKAPGRYNLYLGAAFDGSRMNAPFAESLNEVEIIAALTPLFQRYASERTDGEHFGDFLVRMGTVPAIESGPAFAHAAQALAQTRTVGVAS